MAKIVHPERRMRDEHPWTIYQAIRRLQILEKLTGREDVYIRPQDIAAHLYSNWHDLSVRHSIIVLEAKIEFTLRFLKANHYIKERMERPGSRDPDWSPMKNMDEYQVLYLLSPEIRGVLGPDPNAVCRGVMDEKWGMWIGRKTPNLSKYLVDAD